MANQKLNLTRDQLATFLKNFEQIKQFERLFALADQVSPSPDTPGTEVLAGNNDAKANEVAAQLIKLIQITGINIGNANQKSIQALDEISRMSNALEMLALAPIRNNIELEHDVNGILPYANQTARVRSNQVLTWLSM
jgi:hypothetical protein